MTSNSRGPAVRWLLLLPLLALAATVLPGVRDAPGWNPWLDGVLCGLAMTAATAGAFWRLRRSAQNRLENGLLVAGLGSYTAGHWWWTTALALHVPPGQPSVADVLFLALQPLVLVAVVLHVRRRSAAEASAVWLDGVVGGLAVAAAGAALVAGHVVAGSTGSFQELTVLFLYPFLDVAVLLALGCWASLEHWRPRPGLVLLFAGTSVQTLTDVTYMLARSGGDVASGGHHQVGWALALTLLSLAPGREGVAREERSANRWSVVTVPAVAAGSAVLLLVLDHVLELAPLAVWLATATIVAALVRLVTTLQEVRSLLADRRAAVTDDLTGLTNRRGLHRSAPDLLHRAPAGTGVALLLLDLDRFKEVNDSLGHAAGDELLAGVAHRLRAAAASSEQSPAVLTRLGGDEFALLLLAPRATVLRSAEALADAVHEALRPPLLLEPTVGVRVRASVGISARENSEVDLHHLLREADVAMYHAKSSRLGTSHYRRETDEFASGDRLLDAELLRASIENRELVLHYQPKVDTGSGAVHGVEALVRWQHPHRGLLFPDAFLGLVEDLGLFDELTAAVLEQSLDQAAAWRRDGLDLSVAVNVPAGSLTDPRLPGRLAGALRERDLPPTALEIEITEDFLMHDPDGAGAILDDLRAQGVRVAVDDYGTGYSSLAYLRRLAIDDLKLDRSFVVDLVDDPRALAIVRSTISLAHSLGLRLVAEGVEDSHTRDELAAAGCDVIQGWFYARAMPGDALPEWMAQFHHTRSEAQAVAQVAAQAVAARPAMNEAHNPA